MGGISTVLLLISFGITAAMVGYLIYRIDKLENKELEKK